MITEDQLSKIINRMSYKTKQGEVVEALNRGMTDAEINTPLRTAMFMAQILHESGGFKWLTELGDVAYFDRYENRTDLGNVRKGDGYKFKGRGFIHITGRFNYGKVGDALGLDLVTTPDMAAELVPAARIAGWFWTTHTLNTPSDRRDLKKVTYIINGGYNGLQERLSWYQKVKQVLEV